MKYDYLIVGSGLYGAVFAREAADAGKKVLVIDKRNHIGGNIYTEKVEGINVHKYGAHIFHTNNKTVWDYISRFAEFNNFPGFTKIGTDVNSSSFSCSIRRFDESYFLDPI